MTLQGLCKAKTLQPQRNGTAAGHQSQLHFTSFAKLLELTNSFARLKCNLQAHGAQWNSTNTNCRVLQENGGSLPKVSDSW